MARRLRAIGGRIVLPTHCDGNDGVGLAVEVACGYDGLVG